MRWSESQTFEFVKLYLSHEYLWNNEHEDYKTHKQRLKGYRDIMYEFNALSGISLTISEVKAKIKNLRSTYAQELNKIKCRSGPHYTYEPTIKWFSYWHKHFQRSPKISDSTFEVDIVLEPVDIDHSNQKMWIGDDTENIRDDAHLQSFITNENNNDLSLFLKSEPKDSLNDINRHSPRKIRRRKYKQCFSSTDVSDIMPFTLESQADSDKEDEFDIYGKYIASQLRSMDLSKALRLELEIQNLIGKARLSNMSN